MDHNYLTLAICKRDMRRVIGRQFLAGANNTIWFIGIVGTGLSKYEPFINRAGEFLYIAKLTDVRTFTDYFSDIKDDRMDKIYLPDKNGMYGKKVRLHRQMLMVSERHTMYMLTPTKSVSRSSIP